MRIVGRKRHFFTNFATVGWQIAGLSLAPPRGLLSGARGKSGQPEGSPAS